MPIVHLPDFLDFGLQRRDSPLPELRTTAGARDDLQPSGCHHRRKPESNVAAIRASQSHANGQVRLARHPEPSGRLWRKPERWRGICGMSETRRLVRFVADRMNSGHIAYRITNCGLPRMPIWNKTQPIRRRPLGVRGAYTNLRRRPWRHQPMTVACWPIHITYVRTRILPYGRCVMGGLARRSVTSFRCGRT